MSKFKAKPPSNQETASGLIDYSKSFTNIEIAVSTLRDSMCGGNREKTEAAYLSLMENGRALGRYLTQRGLDVPPTN